MKDKDNFSYKMPGSNVKKDFSEEGNAIMAFVAILRDAQDQNFKEIDKQLNAIRDDLKLIHAAYATKTYLFEKLRETEEFISKR
jgi:hypothetical protein